MFKGWILYNKKDYEKNFQFAQRFIEKAGMIDSEISLVFREDLIIGIRRNELFVSVRGEKVSPPDFIINRSRDSFIARQFELMNKRVYNSSFVSDICNNKARTHQFLSRMNVPCVDTFFCRKSLEFNPDGYQLQYPVVVKSVSGHGGSEVYKAENKNALLKCVDTLEEDEFIIQNMCDKPGRDVRVFVIGKEIIAAIMRSSAGDFRANYSLGGDISVYSLNDNERKLVQSIVNSFDFDFVGIDFLFDSNGSLLFNEIEDVVGSRSLSIKTNIDVVDLYLKYIEETIKVYF